MPAWQVILIGVGILAMLILGIIVSEILVQRQFKHWLEGIEKEEFPKIRLPRE